MSVVRRHIAPGAVSPLKLHNSLRQGTYVYEKFNYMPNVTKSVGYGDPTGATGDVNLAMFRNMNAAWSVKGAGQTILGPSVVIGEQALDVSQDQGVDEGVEYNFGATQGIGNPLAYITGTTKPVQARLKLKLPDVSGAAECAFGFREIESSQAFLDDYTDLACINVQAGVVNVEEILNNAATVTRNSGEVATDGQTIELKVRLTGRGIRYFFNGQELIQAATAYQFQNAINLLPFFFFLHAADLTPVYFDEFEFAYVDDIDDFKVSS